MFYFHKTPKTIFVGFSDNQQTVSNNDTNVF